MGACVAAENGRSLQDESVSGRYGCGAHDDGRATALSPEHPLGQTGGQADHVHLRYSSFNGKPEDLHGYENHSVSASLSCLFEP